MTASWNQDNRVADDRRRLAQELSLSAWDVERVTRKRDLGPRGRVISLRTQQRLRNIFEAEQGVRQEHRSIVRIHDGACPGCLMIHGAGDSPAEYRDLAALLHGAGMNVFAPLLPGHGLGEDMPPVMWRACLNQVRNRFQLLRHTSSQTYIVGHGFGVALALHLARQESVSGLVLLSPALIPSVPMWQRLMLRLGLRRFPWFRRRMGWSFEVFEAMETARGIVSRLECPIYGAQCDDDESASSASLRFVQKKAKHRASRFRVFPEGGYDILKKHGRDCLHGEIRNFIKRR